MTKACVSREAGSDAGYLKDAPDEILWGMWVTPFNTR